MPTYGLLDTSPTVTPAATMTPGRMGLLASAATMPFLEGTLAAAKLTVSDLLAKSASAPIGDLTSTTDAQTIAQAMSNNMARVGLKFERLPGNERGLIVQRIAEAIKGGRGGEIDLDGISRTLTDMMENYRGREPAVMRGLLSGGY